MSMNEKINRTWSENSTLNEDIDKLLIKKLFW